MSLYMYGCMQVYVNPLVHTVLTVIQLNVNTGADGQRDLVCHRAEIGCFDISYGPIT